LYQLQECYHSLKEETGFKVIHQSHENNLSPRSLEMITLMANNRDVLDLLPQIGGNEIAKVINSYLSGISKLKTIVQSKDPELKRFKKHLGTRVEGRANDPDVDDANQSDDM
jgi:hypothetical protein